MRLPKSGARAGSVSDGGIIACSLRVGRAAREAARALVTRRPRPHSRPIISCSPHEAELVRQLSPQRMRPVLSRELTSSLNGICRGGTSPQDMSAPSRAPIPPGCVASAEAVVDRRTTIEIVPGGGDPSRGRICPTPYLGDVCAR